LIYSFANIGKKLSNLNSIKKQELVSEYYNPISVLGGAIPL